MDTFDGRDFTVPVAMFDDVGCILLFSVFDAGCWMLCWMVGPQLQAVDNMLLAHFERYYDNFMANHFVYNFTGPPIAARPD